MPLWSPSVTKIAGCQFIIMLSTMTIIDLIMAWEARTPSALAVVSEDRQLTYAELAYTARRWAMVLRNLGVHPGSMVGLHVERSIGTVIGILAILQAGATYVPLEPSYPRDRLKFIAIDSNIQCIVTQSTLAGTLALGLPTVCIDGAIPEVDDLVVPNTGHEESIAYVTYTSGSTGKPKGVPMPHRGICSSFRWLQSIFAYLPSDRALLKSPLGFDVSSRWELLWPLASGGTVVIARADGHSNTAYLAELVARSGITVMHFVPSMLQMFIEEPSVLQCQHLRRVFSGGEALSYALKRRFFQRLPTCELIDIYGATETIVVTYRSCRPDDPSHERPIGKPIEGLPVYVLDAEGRPVEENEAGEIYVGGDFLASGYLGRPGKTAQRFVPNPVQSEAVRHDMVWETQCGRGRLFRTGDLARKLPSGALEHLGRSDHQIKVRGIRVELGEIESALLQSPLVTQAAVVAVDSGSGGTQLVGFVSLVQDRQVDASRHFRKFLKSRLPEAMIPSRFQTVWSIPLNANGKVDRSVLAERAASSDRPRQEVPTTPTECKLTAVWQSVFDGQPLGVHDDFFAVGGHSILAMRLLIRIRNDLGIDLSLVDLMEGPTIAELAHRIDQGGLDSSAHLEMTVESLLAEANLDPSIQSIGTDLEVQWTRPSSVLLTGATGFLGAFLLSDLLESTAAEVICLVRGVATHAQAWDRLKQVRDRYRLTWEHNENRIHPVIGDLSAPRLGLSVDEFSRLGAQVDAIIHAGAYVNEVYPFSALRGTNVGGTEEVIRLASIGQPSVIHFVSSTAIFESSGYFACDEIFDDASLEDVGTVFGGYAQSKWVAEQMLTEARSRGIPVTIFRPGAITGHSQTGAYDVEQTLGRFLRTLASEGVAPELDVCFTLTPVDFISRAVVHLSRQTASLNQQFNLVSPYSLSMAQIIDLFRSTGIAIHAKPYDVWVDEMNAVALRDISHPIGGILPLLTARIPGTDRRAIEWNTLASQMRCKGIGVLAKEGIHCPPIGKRIFQTYLDWLCQ